MIRRFLAATAVLAALAAPASAQQLLESYVALLSVQDHFNSNGQRLTQPWQIIRQDRANFHRFGLIDELDEWDSFFDSVDNRAAAERMLVNGSIAPGLAGQIVNGEVVVVVEIWGQGSVGSWINVLVY